MDIASEKSYPTPLANSAILPLLLLSLSSQRSVPKESRNIDKEYDYVIVGGGTAGSVLASRLSELSCINVLLLEAGKDPPLLTEVPGLSKFFKFTDIDWSYKTVPQRHTGEALVNKQISLSSGKTLGGSSVLNSMVTTRGNPLDYDSWASNGADGWSYEDVLSYFKKLEDNKDPEYLKNGFHSTGGLQSIHRPRYQSEIKKPVFQAARSVGYKVVDPNALKQTGFYDFQATLRMGQRCSTAKAYLVPAENRTNLHILPKAMVRKIIVKDGEANGVLYDYDNETYTVNARKEVIVSAGTINTAQLLMLSGIGPKRELEKLKIPVVADLPVGENLQDHCAVPLSFVLNSSIPSVLMKLVNPGNVDHYIKTKTGVLSSPDFIAALGFFNSDELHFRNNTPSFQLRISEDMTIIPKMQYGLKPDVYSQVYKKYESRSFITCFSGTLHPRSRGTVRLRSTNPYDLPLIDPNYLEHPKDMRDIVEGLKACKKLTETPAMRKLGTSPFETVFPGCEEYTNREELYFWCLAKQIVISLNNPVGTVKMGNLRDSTVVVDHMLRVKYIKGLRVVDSSIMPTITSGDTTIPTIMIAERASDIIKSTIDCDDFIAESEVQASVPVISISTDILENLPKLFKPPVQRRSDPNIAEQIKEAFSLYNRDKNAYHNNVVGRLQSQIKDLNNVLQKSALSRRQGVSSSTSSSSTEELLRCLDEIKRQLQNKKKKEITNVPYSNDGDSATMVNQILTALNSVVQNNLPTTNRNSASNNEAIINQISSIAELLREDRDVSESMSRSSVTMSNQASTADALNQLIATLNLAREGQIPQIQIAEPSGRNDANNQNFLLNQVLSTIRDTTQSTEPPPQSQNTSVTTAANQDSVQDQLNQILVSINELKQTPPTVTPQNETTPINETVDKTESMMSQILSAIKEMREAPQQNATETTTPPTTTTAVTEASQDTALNQILKTLNEIKQGSVPTNPVQNDTVSNASTGNMNDMVLFQIFSAINEMKQDMRTARDMSTRVPADGVDRQGISSFPDQINNQRFLQQGLNQQGLNSQGLRDSGPLFQTVVVQPAQNSAPQANNFNPLQPRVNGLQVLPPGVQINPAFLQGQRGPFPQLPGGPPGIFPPPPMLGIPGGFPNQQRLPYPPPFLPPGAVPPGLQPNQTPCQNTIVMNNINLCNANNPQRPLTPSELELCQSLHSAANCQNNNCRAIPPYLYRHYCGGK